MFSSWFGNPQKSKRISLNEDSVEGEGPRSPNRRGLFKEGSTAAPSRRSLFKEGSGAPSRRSLNASFKNISKRNLFNKDGSGSFRNISRRSLFSEGSKRNLFGKQGSSTNFYDITPGDNGDMARIRDRERIKNLTTEEAVLKILKVQKELSKVKKRIQDRRSVQQIEIHNLQSRKTKLQHDLKLQMEGSPWTHAEYLAYLRDVFGDEPLPSDKKFSDEAVKTLRQEHKCHLQKGVAKMVSDQNNADLMLVMGSGPELKDEMSKRADRIRKVIDQVAKENLELKNVLHYKEYVLEKMKNRMEISFTRRTSLSAAMVGLKNLELKTLQELADADSVDSTCSSDIEPPGIPQPSKWNDFRNKQEVSGLTSISDDEELEEDEDENEDDNYTSNEKSLGESIEGSLDHNFEEESAPVGTDEKAVKSKQRLKAQLARKQLREKGVLRRNTSMSSASSIGSMSSSGSMSEDSGIYKVEDTKDERTRRAAEARKRLQEKRRKNKLQQEATTSTSEETPTFVEIVDQQSPQNEGNENKPQESNGGAEKPMMSAAQKARLARQRRAEQMKEKNGNTESDSNGTPAAPDLPDSQQERRKAPRSRRIAERQKRMEERLDRTSQHKRGDTEQDSGREQEPESKPLSFSNLAESHKEDNFPTNTLSTMNSDTQARIRESMNKANSNPPTNLNGDGFSELAKSHEDNSFPKNTLASMNADTQARILNSMNTGLIPGQASRSGSLPSEQPTVSSAEQRALQAIADSQRRSSMDDVPTPKRMSSAEQRALQAIADAQKGGSSPSVQQIPKRVSSAEQRALQAIADGQKGGNSPIPQSEKRVSSAEQRALQAIGEAQKAGNGSNESGMDEKSNIGSVNQAETSPMGRTKPTSDAGKNGTASSPLLTPSRRDQMARLQSTRAIESDRVKEQRERAELARKRLEAQRRLRANRAKRNASKNAETGDSSSTTAKTSNNDESSGTDNNEPSSRSTRSARTTGARPEVSTRRNRTTGTAGSNQRQRQTAIERSRARRARIQRTGTSSNDL